MLVGESYLASRLDRLRKTQNPDGGWGYFAGKKSWLEPTVYAALALHGEPAANRAWSLALSCQQLNGSWRPSADVAIDNSATALCVTLACVRGDFGEPFHRGVGWLLSTVGVENTMKKRAISAVARVFGIKPDRDPSLTGWPWKPDESSWVEPTCHSLVALKKASANFSGQLLRERVRLGEAQLFDVRCKDGGWNYGAPASLGMDLPSYPETTALALMGLQGRSGIGSIVDLGCRLLSGSPSPLAQAWLRIALAVNGATAPRPAGEISSDILITALEALATPEGNHDLLKARLA